MWKYRCIVASSAYVRRQSTIYALSSGRGKCGVAVIRISGSKASQAIQHMTQLTDLPKPRLATLTSVLDPLTKEMLDKGLVLWFTGPKSFTGEDCCEFQVHGGPAVVSAVLGALSRIEGFRPAEPGEFTKRAFHAGKLDLTQVEGLGDLIHAETELQRKQALLQMEGTLSNLYLAWRTSLLKNLAHVEAYIDFSEDDNIEDNVLQLVQNNLSKLHEEINNHLADNRCGERLRDGVRTTILGEPNAGKSSLLNALCQRQAAIVTAIEGTTRDIVQLPLNINGYPILLADTAGLRDKTNDIIEAEGISKAYLNADEADLILLVVDASKCALYTDTDKYINNYISKLNLAKTLKQKQFLVIFNKTDILTVHQKEKLKQDIHKNKKWTQLSCTTNHGFPEFLEILSTHLQALCGNPTRESPSITQARHRFHLTECTGHINKCLTLMQQEDVTISAHYLQNAVRNIGKITGKVSSEEILDVIFKDFCIGK